MVENEPDCKSCSSSSCEAREKKPDETDSQFLDRQALQANLCRMRHKIVVLSGKGGVGKSTVAVNLALSMSLARKEVGILDADFHGPSVPILLGLEGQTIPSGTGQLMPVRYQNLKVMSIGFLLPNRDDAVIWRGPMKMGVIKQFLRDVAWGDLDFLVVDCPPGTGDEPLSVIQLMEKADGAVVVTTPQDLSLSDVRKSINFCRQVDLPVLGVVENMSGFACPKCCEVSDIFGAGGGERMAREMGVPFLGKIPIDPVMVKAGDEGKPFVVFHADAPAAKAMEDIVRKIRASVERSDGLKPQKTAEAIDSVSAPLEGGSGKERS